MLLAALLPLAYADSPLVIRYRAPGEPVTGALVAHCTADGASEDIPLNDEGHPPDPMAGDGLWGGLGRLEGRSLSITFTMDGQTLGTTTVTFESASGPRDVDLALDGTTLTAVPSVPGTDTPPPVGPADAPGGGAPLDPSVPPGAGGPLGTAAADPAANGTAFQGTHPAALPTATRSDRSDGPLFIGFGVGLLALLGVGWMWTRRAGGGAGTAEVRTLPTPGLLAAELPSLSDGLVAWVASGRDEQASLVQPLLTLLADEHRVLVVARSDVEVRPVEGGPVHRMNGVHPGRIAEASERLAKAPGPPLVVFVILDPAEADALAELRERLPREIGGIVLLAAPSTVEMPTVVVSAAPVGWRLSSGGAQIAVRGGPHGLERTDAVRS